jgi:hypothetical protein
MLEAGEEEIKKKKLELESEKEEKKRIYYVSLKGPEKRDRSQGGECKEKM